MLECSFEAQDFRPFAYSGDRLSIRLFEHSLYFNREEDFTVLLLNQPYVYKVRPQRLFTKSNARTTVSVYVSNEFSD